MKTLIKDAAHSPTITLSECVNTKTYIACRGGVVATITIKYSGGPYCLRCLSFQFTVGNRWSDYDSAWLCGTLERVLDDGWDVKVFDSEVEALEYAVKQLKDNK